MKKKKMFFILSGVLLLMYTLNGCKLDPGYAPRVYSIIESGGGNGVTLSLFVEGPDGDTLTGSIVTAVNPGNEAALMGFNFTRGCFTGSFDSAQSGDYIISVKSNQFPGEELAVTIEHMVLTEKAGITGLTDSSGAAALQGEDLNGTQPVSAVWSAVENADIYQVVIKKDIEVVTTISTDESRCLIPAGVFDEQGNYSIAVNAQYIAGDPVFSGANYYSASISNGASFFFTITK